MKMIEEKLGNLMSDSDKSLIKNSNLKINKVKIIKEAMDMEINLESCKLIVDKDASKLNEIFQKKFTSFNTEIKFKYNTQGNFQERILFFEKRLIEYIKSNIQSENSWVDSLNWEVNNNSLIIFPPTETASFTISRNGITKSIEQKILDELDIDLIVQISEEKIKEEENFLDTKILEEKTIAVNAVKESNIGSRSGSSKKGNKNYRFGKIIKAESMEIKEINLQTGSCIIEGQVFQLETREIRNNN